MLVWEKIKALGRQIACAGGSSCSAPQPPRSKRVVCLLLWGHRAWLSSIPTTPVLCMLAGGKKLDFFFFPKDFWAECIVQTCWLHLPPVKVTRRQSQHQAGPQAGAQAAFGGASSFFSPWDGWKKRGAGGLGRTGGHQHRETCLRVLLCGATTTAPLQISFICL